MKILFILPTHGFGGCEFNALTVASIVQQRYNVDVYVAYPYVNETEYLGYLCELNNLRTVNLECLFLNRDDIGLVSVQRTATKRLLDNIDPDLVFAAFPWPKRGQGVILALSDVCTPALIKFALVPPSWDKSYIASGVAEQLGKRQMWFANSRYSAELLERHLGLPAKSVDGFHVGPIGLKYLLSQTDDEPQDSVADVRRELDIPPDALMITTVARLSEQKGHAQLFPAIERMAQERPDAVFVWVGDGELRGTLQTEAARKGLADKIRFAGFRTDVRRVLRASDIFALPTLFEGGCSQALLEAMEEGLPCVVTDTSA
ncbi:MAG: glycosyltransferase, partial [Chitinophagales bacterium]|nr:glycosyltransferase [Hyphomicrobiales bacterium]